MLVKPVQVKINHMTDEGNEERRRLYEQTRKELLDRQLSNSQIYDRAILTLSTSALGISLAFIKNVVSLKIAHCKGLLITSWYFFGLAIIITLLSFWASQKGIKKQLGYAHKYYIDEKDEYLTKTNCYAKITEFLNYCSGALFIVAVFLTILFVTINF